MVWDPVWDFRRIWPFKRLWEDTDLSTVESCFQSYWRVPHWSQFAPVTMTQRHWWGLQSSKGRTGAENCEPFLWQTAWGTKGRPAEQQGQNGAAHGKGSALKAMLPWHCTGGTVILCTVIQWSLFGSLLHIPCVVLLFWVHKCSFSWRKISLFMYSFRQLVTGGSSSFKGT